MTDDHDRRAVVGPDGLLDRRERGLPREPLVTARAVGRQVRGDDLDAGPEQRGVPRPHGPVHLGAVDEDEPDGLGHDGILLPRAPGCLDGVMSALVSADELATLLERGEVVLLDVQYELLGPPGPRAVRRRPPAGRPPPRPRRARSPVRPARRGGTRCPTRRRSRRRCARAGSTTTTEVVVYDQRTSLAAGRAWWVLRWAGHPQVRVLDGGMAAWRRAGYPMTTQVAGPVPGDVRVRPGSVPVLDAAGAAALARAGVLLDVRAAERYRGEAEPIDPVAGHVPGRRQPAGGRSCSSDDGTFLPPERLRAVVAAHGVHRDTPVGTTCGSGVTAAQAALALHEAGIAAIPYVGSWSEWVADPARPVATGPDPG